MAADQLISIRCQNAKCGKLLLKARGKIELLEIKCSRCKTVNTIKPPPQPAAVPHKEKSKE